MPPVCVASGCKNTNDQVHKSSKQRELEKKCKITFHVFPSDPIRRRMWINLMELNEQDIKKSSRLCSLHFHEKYFDRTSLACVRLRENAVPHLVRECKSSKFEDDLQQGNKGSDNDCEGSVDLLLMQEKGTSEKQCNKLQKTAKILQEETGKCNKRQFDSHQPHLNTIYNWYKSIDGESGISEEALARLRKELSSIDYFLVEASIIEKMPVR